MRAVEREVYDLDMIEREVFGYLDDFGEQRIDVGPSVEEVHDEIATITAEEIHRIRVLVERRRRRRGSSYYHDWWLKRYTLDEIIVLAAFLDQS